jgi:outer membrane lipoprotein SlyB
LRRWCGWSAACNIQLTRGGAEVPPVSNQLETTMRAPRLATFLLPALLFTGCVGVQSSTRTWSEPGTAPQDERVWYGRVAQISETVEAYRGDPVAGAAAGAVIGGVLGSAMTQGHGGGLFGAMAGAMIGADASRGGETRWFYDVTVRYDEGSLRTYRYEGQVPFRVGDQVMLSARGLSRL